MDTNKKTGTARVRHLDLAAGILILWVITFHALGNAKVFGDVDARVAVPFLTFSMPWFFYKSGTFFNGKRGKDGIRRDIGKLLVPYLKWSAIGSLVVAGFCIASLFHVIDNPRIPVWLSNIPMGLSFFMLGHLLHRYEHKLWLFIPCLAAYIAFLMFKTPVVGLHRNVYLDGNYYLWPVFSICGIMAFNNLCRMACGALDKLPALRFRPISFLGKHSITLLVSHAFVYWPVIHFSTLPPARTFLVIEAVYLLVLIPIICIRQKKTESIPHTI